MSNDLAQCTSTLYGTYLIYGIRTVDSGFGKGLNEKSEEEVIQSPPEEEELARVATLVGRLYRYDSDGKPDNSMPPGSHKELVFPILVQAGKLYRVPALQKLP